MATFTGTGGNDTAVAASGLLLGFTGGAVAELQDAVGDVFDPGEGLDTIRAGDGNDRIRVSVDDPDVASETFDGGVGDDTLVITGSPTAFGILDLTDDTILIESIAFEANPAGGALIVEMSASSFGFGATPVSFITFNQQAVEERVDIFMGSATMLDLTGLGVIDLAAGDSGYIRVFGDNDDETIFATYGIFHLLGAGGADTLNGGWRGGILDGGNGDDILNAGESGDYLNGGADNDTIDGNGGGDVIDGWTGNDIVDGGGGDDQISDGAGDDTVDGGNEDDAIFKLDNSGGDDFDQFDGSDGDDTLVFGSLGTAWTVDLTAGTFSGGSDTGTLANIENVTGGDDNDMIAGSAEANVIDGGDGDDTLAGGGGGDTMLGGQGADSLDGGADDDLISYFESDAGVQARLSTGLGAGADAEGDTYVGIENVLGSAFADTIVGNDAVGNALDGYDGDDTILGRSGDDVLEGGDGDDLLDGGIGADILDGAADTDTVSYAGSTSRVEVRLSTGAGTFGDAEGDTYLFIENVLGSAFDDTIVGSDAVDNELSGGAGADTILGRDGSDALNGDAGDDLLDGGLGADVLNGGADADTASYAGSTAAVEARLSTGSGMGGDAEGDSYVSIEKLIGSAFSDTLVGSDGVANDLSGGADADTILGRSGADTLNGEEGNDLLDGGVDADVLDGGAGNDTVSYSGSLAGIQARLTTGVGLDGDAQGDSYVFIENLIGSGFADTLVGSNLINNKLDGGAGNDTMIGNSGNDILTGGLGKDTLLGGINNDAFVFASAADSAVGINRDTIFDFEDAGENDSIVLTGFAGVLAFRGTLAFNAANQVRVQQIGADVLIQINTTGMSGAESEILLANTSLAQVDVTDFFL